MIEPVGYPPPDLFQWRRARAAARRSRRTSAPWSEHAEPVDTVALSRAARRIMDQERRLTALRRADIGKGRQP